MALINCPECGQQMSSTANICVHCGCEITICADCGRVYKGKIDKCINCGNIINGETLHNKNLLAEENKQIEDRMNKDAKILKNTARIKKALEIISGLLLIGIIVFTVTHKTSNDIESILKFNKMWGWLKAVIVMNGILFCISNAIDDITNLYIECKGCDWIKNNNIDYASYLIRNKDVEEEEIVNCSNKICKTAFFFENTNEKRNLTIKIIVNLILSVAFTVCMCVWLIYNVDYTARYAILGIKTNLQFKVPSFYAVITMAVLDFVATIVIDLLENKRLGKWTLKRFPELKK